MTKTDYFKPHIPRVFAHRGFSYLVSGVDENTIESFRAALDQGASHIETDTQATLDGIAVLFHDTNLLRLMSVDAKVSELTFAELSSYSLPNKGKVPSLDQVLRELPGVMLNLPGLFRQPSGRLKKIALTTECWCLAFPTLEESGLWPYLVDP